VLPSLVTLIREKNLLSAKALKECEQYSDKSLLAHIEQAQLLGAEQLAGLLADKYHCEYVQEAQLLLNAEAFEMLPIEQAKKHVVYPSRLNEGILEVVTAYPGDMLLLQTLEFYTQNQVYFAVASRQSIEKALIYAEANIDQLSGATEDFLLLDVGTASNEQKEDEHAGPIVKFINTTLKTALNRRASDVHIECYKHSVEVKYRIDGQLYPATEALDVNFHSAFISRLKVMAELDIAEKRVPQDGRFKLRVASREIDFRISVLPSIHGENVVIRILDSQGVNRDWEELSLDVLGMSQKQLLEFRRIIREPYGLVLITGPTGSGKTTTLYASLKESNSGGEKIITIEDPVEYQLAGITQIPINTKKGLTFAKGLRSILRHDPDKILIGEIRDAETADIAVQSALTGHLVFSSVHANNAIDVMARMSNMGVNIHNAMSALNAVLAQRLIRILCEHCKELDKHSESVVVYKEKGCDKCDGTGYSGRVMISELLVFTESMRAMVLDGSGLFESFSKSSFVGGENMRQVALQKYYAGVTTLAEVDHVTFA
jgi:type IV pilus assembly protein PilB